MKQGVLIIATGHPFYAQMAFNLACSLKRMSSGVGIALAHDHVIGELNEYQRYAGFSHLIALSSAQGAEPFLLKCEIDNLSPFDETLYLDADTLWMPFKKVNEVFDELKSVEFTIANRGYHSKGSDNDWVDLSHLSEGEKWLDCASEFIYFKKGKTARDIFSYAREYYTGDNKIKRTIGGHIPDEPAFAYALNKAGHTVHKSPYLPTYWEPNGREKLNQIQQHHHILSMGGNRVGDKVQDLYNKWCRHYANEMGAGWFPHVNKHKAIKQRLSL